MRPSIHTSKLPYSALCSFPKFLVEHCSPWSTTSFDGELRNYNSIFIYIWIYSMTEISWESLIVQLFFNKCFLRIYHGAYTQASLWNNDKFIKPHILYVQFCSFYVELRSTHVHTIAYTHTYTHLRTYKDIKKHISCLLFTFTIIGHYFTVEIITISS